MGLNNDTRGWIMTSVSGIGDLLSLLPLLGPLLNYHIVQLVWWAQVSSVSTYLYKESLENATFESKTAMGSYPRH